MPSLKLDQKYLVPVSIGLVLLVALGVSGFFVYRYNSLRNNLTMGQKATEKEISELVETVGKIYELPKGETPTVATVTDPVQLKSQPFFASAQIGDKVLVYINARKGVLYRPSTNRIINVSPINVNKQAVTPSPSETSNQIPQTVRVALYNGTAKSGLANQFEQTLKAKVTDVQFNVVAKSNAQKSDYKLTQVIDLKGDLDEQVIRIAAAMDGENAKLPAGETAPSVDADILIIIGSDYTSAATTPKVLPTASAF